MEERFELAIERIEEILTEEILPQEYRRFFVSKAEFLLFVCEVYKMVCNEELCKLSLDELRSQNNKLYSQYRPDADSLRPDAGESTKPCSAEMVIKVFDAELNAVIPYAFEKDLKNILIRLELFLEMYGCFVNAAEDGIEVKYEDLKSILYYYVCDYTYDAMQQKVRSMVTMEEDFATSIVLNSDWSDPKSLFKYGEYVTDVEIETLKYISSLPKETLKKMADTFTEGYRIGFITTNKDLSKKKIVGIRYNLGFEPVIALAIENFEALGLKPTLCRASMNLIKGRGVQRIGYQGACPSKQYEFDHKDDEALILDKYLCNLRLEALTKAYEEQKEGASYYAGPAVMEVFGEPAFEYEIRKDVPSFSEEQNRIITKYRGEAFAVQNNYIKEEERSFTIIAFPTPSIGENFERIFDEVVKLNTLDYKLYQTVQQTIINTLDLGEYVLVKGNGTNRTNLKISLHKLEKPEAQTNFENCVADVNIPVGEVFTSPLLTGTEGVLNVGRVFLNGLEYVDIMLTIKDGMVTDYTCSNFESEDENRKYIRDNVLFKHKSLPMGEFAIGTNTTAYTMARKFGIEDKMPILIAEKTGPHFAFGDTCYSHAEEVVVYNPDGKEIIARENECSLKRFEDPLKAYFDCHTDITIPYDELGEISVVTTENKVITIIENGRFTLPGTEILNDALE